MNAKINKHHISHSLKRGEMYAELKSLTVHGKSLTERSNSNKASFQVRTL